jgi:hypothetical protein
VDVALDRAAAGDHVSRRAGPALERRGMVRRSRLLAHLDAIAGQCR